MNIIKSLPKILILAGFLCPIVYSSAFADPKVHGLSYQSTPKYEKGFKHFAWADPAAPKGGVFRLASEEPFDKLNPFTIKGRSPVFLSGPIFETLTIRSLDEPFAQYGLLAESIEVAADGLSVTYYLRPEAKFSDGKEVTAEDVVFSFNTLISDKCWPTYSTYYADVKGARALDKKTVKFSFKKKNPELYMILGEIEVLPKHIYGKGDFTKDFNNKAIGSGPYIVKKFEAAKLFEVERNPNYWGKDLNVNAGKWNFDTLVHKLFMDETVMFEGFKAGEFDFYFVNSSKMWAVDVAGPKWDKGWIIKKFLKTTTNEGVQGFVMNLRRPLFQDRTLRKALAMVLDFEWANKTLFYEQYKAASSYFNNSDFSTAGSLPSSEELKLLGPFKDKIPPEVFTEKPTPLGQGLEARQRLRLAKKLLEGDGWSLKDGILTKNHQKLEFKVTITESSWQRIIEPYLLNLKKIGVNASMEMADKSLFQKRMDNFDYDMIVNNYGQSESLGNEQRYYWHSSSADKPGSENYMGLKDPAVDALVEQVIKAPTRKELVVAAKALDRVLWFGYYLVPQWYLGGYRVTYWNKFGLLKNTPSYYSATAYFYEYGWQDKGKEAALEKAIKENKPLAKD